MSYSHLNSQTLTQASPVFYDQIVFFSFTVSTIHHKEFEDNECYVTKSAPKEAPIVSEKQFQLSALSKSGILTTYENQAFMLSPWHFQTNILIESNGMPFLGFCGSDFQRALEIVFTAELFIVMLLSPGYS